MLRVVLIFFLLAVVGFRVAESAAHHVPRLVWLLLGIGWTLTGFTLMLVWLEGIKPYEFNDELRHFY